MIDRVKEICDAVDAAKEAGAPLTSTASHVMALYDEGYALICDLSELPLLSSAIRALRREKERGREALEPLAAAWHKLQKDGALQINADPEKPTHGMGTIRQKHAKRAADLLAGDPALDSGGQPDA